MRLRNFDAGLQPSSDPQAAAPTPAAAAAEVDLGQSTTTPAAAEDLNPASMSEDDFKVKYPTSVATVSVNMGSAITIHVVDGAVYISSPTKVRVPGVDSDGARPLFAYAGGTWISDPAKAWNEQQSKFQ